MHFSVFLGHWEYLHILCLYLSITAEINNLPFIRNGSTVSIHGYNGWSLICLYVIICCDKLYIDTCNLHASLVLNISKQWFVGLHWMDRIKRMWSNVARTQESLLGSFYLTAKILRFLNTGWAFLQLGPLSHWL